MQKLSNGADSTLGEYKKIASAVFGPESAAVQFLDAKIAESPGGENEEVLSAESQVMYLLIRIDAGPVELAEAQEGGE